MKSDDTGRSSDPAKSAEPRYFTQLLQVLSLPLIVVVIPLVWSNQLGDDIRPDKVAPWISAAVSLAAVMWAITRAQVDSARRRDDLQRAENLRRADTETFQERLDAERQHQAAMSASTVIGIVRQETLPKQDHATFVVHVEIRNAGQQPVLEVAIDALLLRREPIAFSEPYVLHPANPEGLPDRRQVQVLEPGQSLSTNTPTWFDGEEDIEQTSEPPYSWLFKSPQPLSGTASINPIGDIEPLFSFTDSTGRAWQRIGTQLPTPRPAEDAAMMTPPDGMQRLWPAEPTLTIRSRPHLE